MAILVIAGALIALGLRVPQAPLQTGEGAAPVAQARDIALYRQIAAAMRAGAAYEETAIAGQRASHYPVRPFLAVRPPLLANLHALLPSEAAADWILAVLWLAAAAAWTWRLAMPTPFLPVRVYMVAAFVSGSIVAVTAKGISLFHEVWAGLLILLSLALRSEKRFAASVLLGLLAALIRELAMPYLAVMALAALWDRRWKEGAFFALALAAAIVALAFHAHSVGLLTHPGDMASQGWMKLGGWAFVLATAKWNLFAVAGGVWVTALLVPLSLLGAAGIKGPLGMRLFFLACGYTLGFTAIGRPENYYWGMMTAPLMGVALASAPAALWDLARQLTRPGGKRFAAAGFVPSGSHLQ